MGNENYSNYLQELFIQKFHFITSKFDNALSNIGVLNERISKDVAFTSEKAFVKYRRGGGKKLSLLPNFFIDALANCSSYKLLSPDWHRFLNYFPNQELINPSN